MATKADILIKASADTRPSFNKKQLLEYLNEMDESLNAPSLLGKGDIEHYMNTLFEQHRTQTRKPSKLKKGDVYIEFVGFKSRPVVVAYVLDDVVVGIPLSTTQDVMNILPSKSRFLLPGYFSRMFIVTKKVDAMNMYTTIYDNPKLLNKAIKDIETFYSTFMVNTIK